MQFSFVTNANFANYLFCYKCTIKFGWLTCRQNWNTLLSRRRKQLLDLSNDTRKLMHVCSLNVNDSNVYFCSLLWSHFMFYIACFSTHDVFLKWLCRSCNFILSPYYCIVHVDLVVTFLFFIFFLISDLVVTYVACVFVFIYKLSFVSIPSSINPFLCHILPNVEPVGQPRETKRVPWFIEPPATTPNLLCCQLAPLRPAQCILKKIPVCNCVFLIKCWNILGQVLV